MGFYKVHSATILGLKVEFVQVEADAGNGLPMFHMVGYLSSEVKEAAERVRTAMRNAGYIMPAKKIVINLSPACVRKKGSVFDLPIAVAVLGAMGIFPEKAVEDILLAGEIEDKNDVYKIKCLKFFGIDEPERVLESYPHELSGGMQQRVLCAMSISCKPKWILADEPTKGMDERLCGVVYDNLLSIKQNSPSSMIIITHDLKLAAQVCDKIAVMYAGQILEINSDLLKKPKHPYSQLFLKSLPENGLNTMQGISPVLGEKIQGCKFAPRCPYCMPICKNNMPDYYIEENVRVRCFLYA